MVTHSSVLPGESQGQGRLWAAAYGVAQSRTGLQRRRSSSGPQLATSSCWQASPQQRPQLLTGSLHPQMKPRASPGPAFSSGSDCSPSILLLSGSHSGCRLCNGCGTDTPVTTDVTLLTRLPVSIFTPHLRL